MAGLRFALSILGVVSALQVGVGQMMMIPGPMLIRHTSHPHHMEPLIRPVQITEEYPSTKEPIDEEGLHQRIKELGMSQQALRQKQMELDDKIASLHEEALRCEKQIAGNQQEIHRLEELERLQYMEQVRLERLIERQRVAEYQEKLIQERLARERELDDMNLPEQRQRNASKKEPYNDTPTASIYETRIDGEATGTYKHGLDERPRNEQSTGAIQPQGPSERAYENERSHSTEHLRPKPSSVQETLPDLQPQMALRARHMVEKKDFHDGQTLELIKTRQNITSVRISPSNDKSTVSSGTLGNAS